MSNINGSVYFGDVSIIFNENDEMIITQDPGDFRLMQIQVFEEDISVKKLVIQQRQSDGTYINKALF